MTPTSPGLLLTILSFILVIGPLVFVHEMGHYLVGRWFGVKAETFSIGFGREIGGWTDKRGTRWKIGWLPLGGYVKFKGELAPADSKDDGVVRGADASGSFDARPPWQRFLIVAAGPVTNLIVAVIIFIALFAANGLPTTPPVIAAVVPGTAAEAAGLRAEDRVRAVNGRDVATFAELHAIISLRPGQALSFTVERDGRVIEIAASPRPRVQEGQTIGTLGIQSPPVHFEQAGAVDTVAAAFRQTGEILNAMVVYVRQIITGARAATEMGGPLKIAQMSGEQVSAGWIDFIVFAALISINLGFINLLPVPLLDGGHLVLYAIEIVRGRPVSARVQGVALQAGLAMLVTLMVFVTANDLESFGVWTKLRGLIG